MRLLPAGDKLKATHPHSRIAGIGLASLVAMTAGASAQAPPSPPSFQAAVEVIRLSLSVTDAHNHLVAGLSGTDFAVFEDGVRQDVAFFTRDPLPLSVALLVDGSSSMEEKLPVAQEAGIRFVKTLRPGDMAQIVQFADRAEVLQDFTADHAALETALRKTQAQGATALYTALYVALKQLRSQGNPEAPRRRAIVLLTDGEDTASVVSDEQVLELARQADVGIYVIALRADHTLDRQRLAYTQATYFMTAITRDTGGEAYFPGALSELDAVYGRIADELRSQYTIGYASANDKRNGKWRRIVVRMPAREDLRVRHKLGYYASKG